MRYNINHRQRERQTESNMNNQYAIKINDRFVPFQPPRPKGYAKDFQLDSTMAHHNRRHVAKQATILGGTVVKL